MSGEPYPKTRQLARGTRRYRRKVASPKHWQAIIEAKRGPCRLAGGCSMHIVQLHHLVPRAQGGDDVADNIVPLCAGHHLALTHNQPVARFLLASRLTDAEYAYVVGKLGEGGMARLFGTDAAC